MSLPYGLSINPRLCVAAALPRAEHMEGPMAFDVLKGRQVPDLSALPGEAYLTRNQLAALTGFSIPAFKLWSTQDRGPRITRIEGRPRYKVADVRAWIGVGHA